MNLFDVNFLLRTLKQDEPKNKPLIDFYEAKKVELLKRINERIKVELTKL